MQQAINVQQKCAATICTYINGILPHIMRLEQTVLELQQKITMEQDRVQIDAPNYDLDTDRLQPPRWHVNTVVVSVQEHLTSSQLDTSDAAEPQTENDTAGQSSNFTYHNFEESHGFEDFSRDIQDHTTPQNQNIPEYTLESEEIPELEEDWDNRQFEDAESNLITHHNTHSERKRIRWDYTQWLLDLTDNQYYEEETPIGEFQYSIPDPDYYGSSSRRSQKTPHDPSGYYPSPPDPADYSANM